jgi:uncharacterized membrane protein
MEEWLQLLSHIAILVINLFALVIIFFGTAEAFVGAMQFAVRKPALDVLTMTSLRFSRWLAAGLSFQLAADILETAISPSWAQIGQLGAIAVIRTFLNFFLDRDMGELRKRADELVLPSKD